MITFPAGESRKRNFNGVARGGVEMGRDVENCPLKWMKTHGRCKKRLEDPQCLRLIAELMRMKVRANGAVTSLKDEKREFVISHD